MRKSEETSRCPKCGAPLPGDAPEGLCPHCLVAMNLDPLTEAGTKTRVATATASTKPPPPAPAEIAPHFPQLEIIECLGRGGMGAVYKARQTRIDRFVALKILSPERQGDTRFVERFEREARTLARLNHPNIVTIHDYGEAGGFCYLLMEFVEGATLRDLLRQGKLSASEALAIVPKICDALQYAHGKGIVHRDIKPENILLTTDGQVKIADFGIAKLVEPGATDSALTGVREVVGTPHYMAPEQAEKPGTVDHRADIFSLGVVFYEMLTGELPLGRFPPPSRRAEVDVRLDEVVLRALEKEPELRYQRASEVKTELETIGNSARNPAILTAEPRRSALTGGRVLLLGLAVVMVGLLVGGWLFWKRTEPIGKPAGCVAWWRAEGDARDSVGTNHGVLWGGAEFSTGKHGQGFKLDGVDDWVAVPDAPDLNFTKSFTIEFFFMADSWNANNSMTLVDKRSSTSCNYGVSISRQWGLQLYYNDPSVFGGDHPGNEFEISSSFPIPTPGEFHHFAGSYSQKDHRTVELKSYLDGRLIQVRLFEGNLAKTLNHVPLAIGASRAGAGEFFKGVIDEVALYSRALSVSEIAAIYNTGSREDDTESPVIPTSAHPQGLIACWQAEGTGEDSFGVNHGTLINGVTYGPGRMGKRAFLFDGGPGKIVLGDPPALRFTDSFSIEAWILLHALPRGPHGQILFRGDMRGCLDPYYFCVQPDGRVRLQISDESIGSADCGDHADSAPITLEEWHHVAGVFDRKAGAILVYVDGQLSGRAQTKLVPFANLHPAYFPGVTIGNHSGNFSDQGFEGLIDELAAFNRALAPKEIAAVYKQRTEQPIPKPPTTGRDQVPQGLVAWWRAEGNALDAVGGNHGVLVGDVVFAPGKVGDAFEFATPNSTVRVPASPSLGVGLGGGFTVEAWIHPTNLSQRGAIIEWNDGDDSKVATWGVHMTILRPDEFGLGAGNLFASVRGVNGQAGFLMAPGGTLTTNGFQHVALTYDKAEGIARLLCNGVVVAQSAVGVFTPQTSYDFYIGSRPAGDGKVSFPGAIDEVRLYNRALTQEELARIYEANRPDALPARPAPRPPVKPEPARRLTAQAGSLTER